MPKRFKVGEAPWEKEQPKRFKVGEAPWENQAAPAPELTDVNAERPWYSITPEGVKQAFENTLAPLETGARSFNEMVTLGLTEPITSAANAGVRALQGEDFSEAYKRDVERRRQLKEQNPASNLIGGIAGAVVPTGPAAYLGKMAERGIAKAAPYIPEIPYLAQNYPSLARYLNLGTKGAAEGALGTGAILGAQQGIEQGTGFIKPGEEINIPEAMAFGGKLGASVKAGVPFLEKNAPDAFRNMMSVFFGPNAEHMKRYMANPEAVNTAPSIEQIKAYSDDAINQLRDQVAKKQISLQEAQSKLAEIQNRAKNLARDAGFSFSTETAKMQKASGQAQANLERQNLNQVEALKQVRAPTHLATDVEESIMALKQKVTEGSQKAYDTLDSAGLVVDMLPVRKTIFDARQKLRVAGQRPVTPTAKASFERLSQTFEDLSSLPEQIDGPTTKLLIQQLDDDISYVKEAGGFSDDMSRALVNARRQLDGQLKKFEPYKKQMELLAPDAKLLEESNKYFGTPRKAVSALNNIHQPGNIENRKTLFALGNATGRDFKEPVEQFSKVKGTLQSQKTMESLKQKLPEYTQNESLKQQLMARRNPEYRQKAGEKYMAEAAPDLAQEQRLAERNVKAKEIGLSKAESELEPLKNLTPANIQGRFETLMRGKPEQNIELRRQLEQLSQRTGRNVEQDLMNLRTQNAFNQGRMHGSRNVNLFSRLGKTAAGAVAGAQFGAIGAGLGAAAGATVDVFGPQMSKKIIDAVQSMGNSPTIEKIRAFGFPPQVQAYMIRELQEHEREQNGNKR